MSVYIKIKRCSNPSYWYVNVIGDVFEVEKWENQFLTVDSEGNNVYEGDCELITEETFDFEKMTYPVYRAIREQDSKLKLQNDFSERDEIL